MKRLAVLLVTTAALAFASSASAFFTGAPFSTVEAGDTAVSGNTFSFQVNRSASGLSGFFAINATDANGSHSYSSNTATCLSIDSVTASTASALFLVDPATKVGEPATLFGVLVQMTDPQPQSNDFFSGFPTGTPPDLVAFTNLNASQYQRALTAGCPAAPGRQAVPSPGNILISKGTT